MLYKIVKSSAEKGLNVIIADELVENWGTIAEGWAGRKLDLL